MNGSSYTYLYINLYIHTSERDIWVLLNNGRRNPSNLCGTSNDKNRQVLSFQAPSSREQLTTNLPTISWVNFISKHLKERAADQTFKFKVSERKYCLS
jgi:hypothetical protein